MWGITSLNANKSTQFSLSLFLCAHVRTKLHLANYKCKSSSFEYLPLAKQVLRDKVVYKLRQSLSPLKWRGSKEQTLWTHGNCSSRDKCVTVSTRWTITRVFTRYSPTEPLLLNSKEGPPMVKKHNERDLTKENDKRCKISTRNKRFLFFFWKFP